MSGMTLPYFLSYCIDVFLTVCEMYQGIPVFGGSLLLFICAYTLITLIIEEFLGEERDE